MPDMTAAGGPDPGEVALYSLGSTDPDGALVDRAGASAEDLAQIDRIMAAMGRLRSSAASRRHPRPTCG